MLKVVSAMRIPLTILGADSPRIETALLPDHPGKELDGQRVLRR